MIFNVSDELCSLALNMDPSAVRTTFSFYLIHFMFATHQSWADFGIASSSSRIIFTVHDDRQSKVIYYYMNDRDI